MSDKPRTPSIHEGRRRRVRERYLMSGLDDFASHEILELLLFYTHRQGDVNKVAHELINRFGSLSGVLDASIPELTAVEQVGENTAVLLHMLPALCRRYMMDKTQPVESYDTLAKIGTYLHARYVGVNIERVYLMMFDNGMHLIDCCHIVDGTVNSANVSVRSTAEHCLFAHASSAVLAHNHPHGLTVPSGSDIDVTRTVECALETIGIPLLEHIIVTEHSYAPMLRTHKGTLRASPITGQIDEAFYKNFYGET